MVSAGEASGDYYAALLLEELRRRWPETEFFGCGGAHLRAAGLRTVVRAEDLAVVGIIEVIGHLPRIWAEPYLASGALVEKQTLAAKPNDNFMVAWPKAEQGKSLKWFIQHLAQPHVRQSLIGPVPMRGPA